MESPWLVFLGKTFCLTIGVTAVFAAMTDLLVHIGDLPYVRRYSLGTIVSTFTGGWLFLESYFFLRRYY